MKYNNRIFPHPVLGIEDDIDGNFEVRLRVSSDHKKISVTPSFILSNESLEELVKKKEAAFVTQIYCRGTLFRKTYKTTESMPSPILIDSTKLNDKVEVDFFICADNSIENYKNDSASKDYQGYTFTIERGDILALGGSGNFYANKSPEELKSVSAFMNIDTSGDKNKPMYNHYDGNKITIMLSQDDYDQYQLIKLNPYYTNTLHSSVVLPALIETLRFMDSDSASDYKEYKWFTLLSNLKDEHEGVDLLQIAQQILSLPVNRSFTRLTQLMEEN